MKKTDRDHGEKQERLQNRGHVLHAAANLHAFPLQQRKQQDDPGGNRPHVAIGDRE